MNYDNTNTEVHLPVSYTTSTYHVVCELGLPANNGTANSSIKREDNTVNTFYIWGDYSNSIITNNPTSYIAIGY